MGTDTEDKLVLVVEDEEDIQQMVCYNLLRNGYLVASATSGEDALGLIEKRRPDLVVLDIMLPGISGLDLCRMLRKDKENSGLPVILLTARGEDNDVVAGLDAGADDYVGKPFSPTVLMARVAALLRRSGGRGEAAGVINIEGLLVDSNRHLAEVDGEELDLTPTEFALLLLFASRPGWVFSRDQIIEAVRGHGYAVTSRSVDVQIFGLRKKMGRASRMVETVRGIGYRLVV